MTEITENKTKRIDIHSRFSLLFISFIISLPLYVLAYPYLPILTSNILGHGVVDHLFYLVSIFLIIRILLLRFGRYTYVSLGLGLVWLTINTFTGGYGFKQAAEDYYAVVSTVRNDSEGVLIDSEPFYHAHDLKDMVHSNEKEVRNFALQLANIYFTEYEYTSTLRPFVQSLSIFKSINRNWKYVSDPVGREYFALPIETISHYERDSVFMGDCDDHTVLMASLVQYVGGKVRMVRTTGHVYPELKVGNRKTFDRLVYYLRHYWFTEESEGKKIYYHIDQNDDLWINLDYTATYPGGEFLEEDIIGVLEL